jgi:hypothetical protein
MPSDLVTKEEVIAEVSGADQPNTEDKEEEDTPEGTTTTPEGITTQIKIEEKTPLTTQTISNKPSKHLHPKEAQTMGVKEPRLDKQANGALIAEKLHTTQPNVGATERKQ